MDKFLNKNVRIILKTGVGIEGIPVSWDDKEVTIKYIDSNNFTVIFNPNDNIMMISVFGEPKDSPEYIEHSDEVDNRKVVEPEMVEDMSFEPNPDLRAQNLVDLRLKKKEEVKKMITAHISNKVARIPNGVSYGNPNFQK